MEHKSHTIKVSNLPKSKTLCTVANKSTVTLAVMWLSAFIVSFFIKEKIALLPITVYLFIVTLSPYKLYLTGHNSFLAIYNRQNKELCDIIYLSEIKNWEYSTKYLTSKVRFFLNDGEEIVVDKVANSELYSYLHTVANKKEITKDKKGK